MAIPMARPTQRSGTGDFQFRRRIPPDIAQVLASIPKGQRPSGSGVVD